MKKKESENVKLSKFGYIYDYNEKIKFYGLAKANFNTDKLKGSVGVDYQLLPNTLLKGKFENDFSFSMGIVHKFRNLINFGYVYKLTLGDFKEIKSTGKFGLSLNIAEEN